MTPPSTPSPDGGEGWRSALFMVLLSWILIWSLGLGSRELWNPVEPRYAGLVKAIRDDGQWLAPREADVFYDQKPPLVFWASALLTSLPGQEQSLFWLRLPSALAVLAVSFALLLIGCHFFGARAGLLAALVWQTGWLPFWSGTFLHLDTAMTASICWFFYAGIRLANENSPRRGLWMAIGAISAFAACMIKGPLPLALALVLLGFLAWRSSDGRLPKLRDLFRSSILRAALAGLLVALLWFGWALYQAGGAWAYELVVRQGLFRLADERPSVKHGVTYYLISLFSMSAPWCLLVLAALATSLRRRVDRPRRGLDRDGVAVLLLWIGLVFVVLNLGLTRRSRYLMPLLPPLALLVGRFVDLEVCRGETRTRLGRVVTMFTAIVVALSAGVVAVGGARPSLLLRFVDGAAAETIVQSLEAAPGRVLFTVSMSLAGLFAVSRILKADWRRMVPTTALTLSMIWCSWGLFGAPAFDRVRQDQELLQVLEAPLQEGRQLVIAGRHGHRESVLGWYHWYTGHWPRRTPFEDPAAALERWSAEKPLVILVSERDERFFSKESLAKLREITTKRLGHKRIRVFLN